MKDHIKYLLWWYQRGSINTNSVEEFTKETTNDISTTKINIRHVPTIILGRWMLRRTRRERRKRRKVRRVSPSSRTCSSSTLRPNSASSMSRRASVSMATYVTSLMTSASLKFPRTKTAAFTSRVKPFMSRATVLMGTHANTSTMRLSFKTRTTRRILISM